MVRIEEDGVDNVIETWGHALVGYIDGGFPGIAAISRLTSSWKVPNKFQVHKLGCVIFRFDNEADRQHILQGPYMIFGRPLVLKNMPPLFEFGACKRTIMPIWVTLPGLPMDLWNEKALAKICSKIGKTLSTDAMIEKKKRVPYVWALIEVDIAKELVKEIYIQMTNGNTGEKVVFYENLPKFFSLCKMSNHSLDSCKKKEQKVKRGKQKAGTQK